MNILSHAEQQQPYSLLVQAETEFTIYLPPRPI
jgi:hypothetical protein